MAENDPGYGARYDKNADDPFRVDYAQRLKPRPTLDSEGVPSSFMEALALISDVGQSILELYSQLEKGDDAQDYATIKELITKKNEFKNKIKEMLGDYDVELAWRHADAAKNLAQDE